MKKLTGLVVSNKMKKTVVVEVESRKLHPLYKKIVKKTKRYKAHCEKENVKKGDRVRIVETKPISKEKHYLVEGVVK